jgi:dihydrolipoamide dehydrogenase
MVDAMEEIATNADADAAMELRMALVDEGIEFVTNAYVTSVKQEGAEVEAVLSPRDGRPMGKVRASKVLLASGRVPNLEGLGLEAAGVETTKLGIAVDEHLRTNVDGIWAAGDVTAVAQFTPVAQYQARVAVDNMFGGDTTADYSALPTAIFTDPELAQLGLTEDDAREQGFGAKSVRHELRYVQRAQYTDTKRGLFKIVYDGMTRRVLGVHVVCRGASDIVQGLAVALKLGVTIDDMAHVHHAFPTFGEGLKAAAEKAI